MASSENALDSLRESFRRDMNDITDDVMQGSCANYEEYRYKCGLVHGLARAERELLDLQEIIENA